MADKVTEQTILDAAIPAVADKITLGWNMIVGMKDDGHGKSISSVPLPSREEREKIAGNFLTTRKLVIGDKEYLDIDKLTPEQEKELTKNNLDVAGLRAFSDPAKREKLAAAVDEGVQSQDNWMSKIGNFLSGLIAWVMNGFKGGFDGLWAAVGESAAQNVSASVDASVNKAMAADPSLQSFSPYMGMMHDAIDEKVMAKATGKTAEQRGIAGRPEVTPLPTDPTSIKTAVTKEVDATLTSSLDDKKMNASLAKLLGGTGATNETNTDKRLNDVKTSLKSFALQVATDKNFKLGNTPTENMSDAKFKTAVREKLVTHFKEMNVTDNKIDAKDDKQIKLTDWYQNEWLDSQAGKTRFGAAAAVNKASELKDTVRGWLSGHGSAEKEAAPSVAAIDLPPANKDDLPAFLADKVLAQMKPDEIANLKAVRNMAEKDFNLDLPKKLELLNSTAIARKKAIDLTYVPKTPDGYKPVATTGTSAVDQNLVQR